MRKVSIIPPGQALGVTFQSPQTDRYGYSVKYLRGRIVGALGGRAAEEIVYGDMTTGAESDLEQVTRIARQMVGRWGMSPAIGPVSVLPPPGQEAPFGQDGVAPATKQLVDEEVRRIVDDCYAEAVTTLREHRDELDRLAHTLLQRETLDSMRTRHTRPRESVERLLQPRSPAARRPVASLPRAYRQTTRPSTPKTAYHCASAAPPSPLPDMSPCRGAGSACGVAGSLTGVWRRRLFYARPA